MPTGLGRGARFALRVHFVERTSFHARVCNQNIIPQNPSDQAFVGYGRALYRNVVKLRPNYGFRAGEQHAVHQRHGASRGKQRVFIRPYDICTDASPRWCLTGPQGRVRAVLCWGSPSPFICKE